MKLLDLQMSQLVRFLLEGRTPGVLMNLPAVGGVNGRFPSQHHATPLHIAASYGHASVVERLLREGADLFAVDDHGQTPLDMAQGEARCVLGAKVAAIEAAALRQAVTESVSPRVRRARL